MGEEIFKKSKLYLVYFFSFKLEIVAEVGSVGGSLEKEQLSPL